MSHLDFSLGQTLFEAVNKLRERNGKWDLNVNDQLSARCWDHLRYVLEQRGGAVTPAGDDVLKHDGVVEKVGVVHCWGPAAHDFIRGHILGTPGAQDSCFTNPKAFEQGCAVKVFNIDEYRETLKVYLAWRARIKRS